MVKLPVVAIVPARGGSKGIPGKNVKNFCGKPLISWTILALQASGITTIYVSTDSEEIASVALSLGAVVVPRPSRIAGDEATSEDAILHVIDEAKIDLSTVVVFAQATSPIRRPSDVKRALRMVHEREADSVFAAVRIDDLTVWQKREEELTPYLGADLGGRPGRQLRPATYVETGSFYISTARSISDSRSRVSGKVLPVDTPWFTMHELDRPEDWSWLEKLKQTFKNEEK